MIDLDLPEADGQGGVIEKDEDEVKARLSYVVNAIASKYNT